MSPKSCSKFQVLPASLLYDVLTRRNDSFGEVGNQGNLFGVTLSVFQFHKRA